MTRYLLGAATEEEKVEVEGRFLRDAEYFSQLRALEYEIVDDYVRGEMPAARRRTFERRVLASPQGREQVARARRLHQQLDQLASENLEPEQLTIGARKSPWERVRAALIPTMPVWQYGMAAVLLLLLVGGSWLLRESSLLRQQIAQLSAEREVLLFTVFLRTGKRMAEGQRIISIAFREPPKSMFPAGSGVGAQGPDHLTFDLADASKMSLSFYGKRPGPGMRLDKLSLQFAMHDTGMIGEVLEAYERLILDAMRGDHTLFTTAEGIERLWEVSIPLLESPPPVRLYEPGSWGPKSIHQLVAPHAWRLPFERAWRDPNTLGA